MWRTAQTSTVRRRTWATGVALTVLAGCATRQPPAAGVDVLTGRLILQIGPAASQPPRQWSAGFELRGTGRAGELDLTSPLGTVVAQARWRPGQAELVQASETIRFAGLPELSRHLLGEAGPLEALFDWLRGRPAPQAPHQLTSSGFVQQGWSVEITGLAEGLFIARRTSSPEIALRVRLEGAP
ncbi:MAG: lipoprotein insertase outer membrane protein LolB [Rubrivivax sp.]